MHVLVCKQPCYGHVSFKVSSTTYEKSHAKNSKVENKGQPTTIGNIEKGIFMGHRLSGVQKGLIHPDGTSSRLACHDIGELDNALIVLVLSLSDSTSSAHFKVLY